MAEALVGGAFLSASLQVLFDRLASPELINFFRGRKHDERLLRKLKLKLLTLNQVLNDAENKQITDQAVKDWLDELKDAVYQADDLVDEIATQALRCKVEAKYQSRTNQVQSPNSTSTSLFDAEIESKLKVMIEMLEEFEKEKDALGLTEVDRHNWSHRLPTSSLVDESRVYGRENEKEEIMEFLLSDGESSDKIGVIPIVGMGGVGKTTLAQLLYNDIRADEHFGTKAWVCVSDIFEVLRITRTVVEAVTGKTCKKNELNSLQVKLKESLSGKKFLIVLDDVWNENYDCWDALMTPFRFGAQGSRIIVTTRNNSVASIVQTIHAHGLRELSEKECWKLFAKHAFKKGDCSTYPDLERIGKEIVGRCRGLPLAAKTLGGLLRCQRDVKDWNNILKSAIWELPEEKSNILPALRLSYYHLPSHLKRCFAYCSIFTKDYAFDVEELVLTWIAEGFLEKPKSNKKVEEEGYECFHELLSRSFFQRSNAHNSCFVMHDLVHDLAQSVSGDFYYRVEDGKPRDISEKVRHFSYVQGSLDGFEKFKVIKEAKYLRTFLPLKGRGGRKDWFNKKVLDEILLDEILPRLTRLRFLSLSGYRIRELPHSIGNLIHLRFLDLSNTYIRQLPESICTMYNLETLLLSNCLRLTTLPADLEKLTLLRRLDLSGTNFLTEMPMHMSKLKDLQQLTNFFVGKSSGSGINELKELYHLHGTISISGLQNVTSGNEALEAKMREKMHLETLELEWGRVEVDDSQNVRDVLEMLQPHTNLKHLRIENYGGTRFPAWLGDRSFCSMVSLYLVKCEFCFSLPPLGQLPSLKDLLISSMPGITKVGHDFYGESGCLSKPFPSLQTLRFEIMSEWVDWCILDAGEFPRLQQLDIFECPKLIGYLPKKVPSLVTLEIRDCPELVASLPRSTSLRELRLRECQGVQLEWHGLSSVETVEISDFASLKEFPSELVTLTSLKELTIMRCPSLLSSPDAELLPMLKSLCIDDCEAMHCFPGQPRQVHNLELPCVERSLELVFPLSEEMSHCYTSLVSLDLYDCQCLKSLPLGLFPKLQRLQIVDCKNFETLLIPNGIELQNMSSLSIFSCTNMVSFPCGGLPAPNLSYMIVEGCKKLKALPERMHTLLRSLISLTLHACPEVESFPEGGLPPKLRDLTIWNCKKLIGGRRDWGLQTLPSLRRFTLRGDPQDGVMELFPEEGLLPSTLTSLRMKDLSNLKSLNNRALQLLCSLKHMEIWECPQLQSLPEEGLPTSLLELQVARCPLLEHRCRREEGEDWHKIAHVPFIYMNGEAILDQVSLGPVPYYSFGDLEFDSEKFPFKFMELH